MPVLSALERELVLAAQESEEADKEEEKEEDSPPGSPSHKRPRRE